MFSLKNGMLSIKYDFVHVMEFLYEILFAINMVAIFLFANVANIAPAISVVLFGSSVILLIARKNKIIRIHGNFIWYGLFTVYAALSCLWSENAGILEINSIIQMIIVLITVTSVSIYVDSSEKLERLMSVFIFSVIIVVLYEFINTPVDLWFKGFFGSNSTGSNSNYISFTAFCAELMLFYKAYVKGKKFNYIFIAFLMFYILLSSSRKALILGILGPLLIVIFTTEKRGYLFRILVFFTIIVGVLYFIMTNDALYSILGVRLERMFDFAVKDLDVDGSLRERTHFVEVAKEMFAQSPVIGQGQRSFININGTYAHNNFWQILSEYGIVGFIIYYSFYVYCIVNLIKGYFINKNKLCLPFLVFLVLLVMFEVGIVSLYMKYYQIVIAFAYTATYIESSDFTERKYKYKEAGLMQTAIGIE